MSDFRHMAEKDELRREIARLRAENADLKKQAKDLQHDLNGAKGNVKNLLPTVDYWKQQTAKLEAENADLRSGSYLASVVEERDRYRAALIEASTRMKNARGAVESNQVADKDVHGTLTRGMFEIAEALGE